MNKKFSENYREYIRRLEFLYFAARRQRTATKLIWVGGMDNILSDASYCLDRPDFVAPTTNFADCY